MLPRDASTSAFELNSYKTWAFIASAITLIFLNPSLAAEELFLFGDYPGWLDRSVDNQRLYGELLDQGASVHVKFDFGTPSFDIEDFFGALPGVTVTRDDYQGELTDSVLDSVDLFFWVLPNNELTPSELSVIQNFLPRGNVVFIRENAVTFEITQSNRYINETMEFLGSEMRPGDDSLDPSLHITTNIADTPFTVGVDSYSYGAINTVTGGTTLVSTRDSNLPFMAFENVPEPELGIWLAIAMIVMGRIHSNKRGL